MSLVTISHDVPSLALLFQQAPEIATEELHRSVLEALTLLEGEVQERTPEGVGGAAGLRGSIARSEPEILPEGVIGLVTSSSSYVAPVETGSKPHHPPIEPLQDWVVHKLGLHGDEAEEVAEAIAWKIAKYGTKGAFMFKKAFEENEQLVQKILQAAPGRIVARLGNQ